MAGFRFLLNELIRETKALKAMARRFLDASTTWSLDGFLSDLQGIQHRDGGTVYTLQIQELKTVPSKDYEAGNRQGGSFVHAVISGIWELRAIGGSSAQKREVEFCGKASMRIELRSSQDLALGKWRMELGDANSPGCYVHAQILGDSEDPPFPRSVPIPRLPILFVTPMGALEFVLGELYQDEWAKEAAAGNSDALYWRARQRIRFEKLFSWFSVCLQNPVSSPWVALKEAKPQGESLSD